VQLCKFHYSGTCTFREKCNFAHGLAELRQPPFTWDQAITDWPRPGFPTTAMFQHAVMVEMEADCFPSKWHGYAPPPGLGVGAAHFEATAIPGDAKPGCEEGAVQDELLGKDKPNIPAAQDNPVMADRPHEGNPVKQAAAAMRECVAPGRTTAVNKPPSAPLGGMTAEATPDKVPPAWPEIVVIALHVGFQCVC